MADPSLSYQDNVSGRFYVDQDCINCGLCSELAPANFCNSKDKDHDIVYKQPSTEEELQSCQEAADSCPVEAIGDDGK